VIVKTSCAISTLFGLETGREGQIARLARNSGRTLQRQGRKALYVTGLRLPERLERMGLMPRKGAYDDAFANSLNSKEKQGEHHFCTICKREVSQCVCNPSASERLTGAILAQTDPIAYPSHYTQGNIEVREFILDQKLDYLIGHVVRYCCRARHKGKELEDYRKAANYLDRKIKELESD